MMYAFELKFRSHDWSRIAFLEHNFDQNKSFEANMN